MVFKVKWVNSQGASARSPLFIQFKKRVPIFHLAPQKRAIHTKNASSSFPLSQVWISLPAFIFQKFLLSNIRPSLRKKKKTITILISINEIKKEVMQEWLFNFIFKSNYFWFINLWILSKHLKDLLGWLGYDAVECCYVINFFSINCEI